MPDTPELSSPSPPVRRLSEITDPAAVEAALAEFRDLGRESFLKKYGLDKARDYFILDGQDLFDSKPILSLAYSYQHPSRGLLSVTSFSGGADAAVRALTRLGYRSVTRAELDPPRLGTTFSSRTQIFEAYGGDKIPGIVRFPGDDIINVFSDANGPYSDDAPSLTESFGYRGEGLNGPQRLVQRGNAMLERARTSGSRVRFWYRPVGGDISFLTWAVVQGRAWIAGVGEDGVARPELEWHLIAAPPEESALPESLVREKREADAGIEDNPQAPEAQAAPSYKDLVGRVESLGQRERTNGVPRVNYARSAAARRAVLLRAGGKCESNRCTGMPAELNNRGQPILDVDHIEDLGRGGADHPSNMAALCPNCHACKTRGANQHRWRVELKKVADSAHRVALARGMDFDKVPERDSLAITKAHYAALVDALCDTVWNVSAYNELLQRLFRDNLEIVENSETPRGKRAQARTIVKRLAADEHKYRDLSLRVTRALLEIDDFPNLERMKDVRLRNQALASARSSLGALAAASTEHFGADAFT